MNLSFLPTLRLTFTVLAISTAACGGSPRPNVADDAGGLDCASFCADDLAICTGTDAQYASSTECLTACSGWAVGTAGSGTGDTLACRSYHLGVAAGDLSHCPHTSATGGGICQ